MFERFTEDARRAVFYGNEEASRSGASCIEAEHLLLGILRSCQPEFLASLHLTQIESMLRSRLPSQPRPTATRNLALSNQNKRILAYAAEEAVRLNSSEIDSRHLLLGVLREPSSVAATVLHSQDLNLSKVRELLGNLGASRVDDRALPHRSRSRVQKRVWLIYLRGVVVQFAPVILLGLLLAKSPIAGQHLLLIGGIWLALALIWMVKAKGSFAWSYDKLNRSFALVISYLMLSLYQVFVFGWIAAFGVGIYRVIRP